MKTELDEQLLAKADAKRQRKNAKRLRDSHSWRRYVPRYAPSA